MASGRSQFSKLTSTYSCKPKSKKNKGCGKVMPNRRKTTRYT